MNESRTLAHYVARRAELIVELFLQDLGAKIVSGPDPDVGPDFVIGFPNSAGGLNLSAIEVKATEHPAPRTFPLPKKGYARLANSNVPSMLLIVDVKHNRLYHAWPKSEDLSKHQTSAVIRVPVSEVDEKARIEIRKRLGAPKQRTGGARRAS